MFHDLNESYLGSFLGDSSVCDDDDTLLLNEPCNSTENKMQRNVEHASLLSEGSTKRLHELNSFIETGDWNSLVKKVMESKTHENMLHLLGEDSLQRMQAIERLADNDDWDGVIDILTSRYHAIS